MAQSRGRLRMEEIKNEYRGVIYCYTNTVNGKMYVGKTIHEERRPKEHLRAALRDKDGSIFHKAIKKYGLEAFTYEILVKCLESDEEMLGRSLNRAESYYIRILKVQGFILYNLTNGGDGAVGRVPTEETRRKISVAQCGEKSYWYGRHRTEETKKKNI